MPQPALAAAPASATSRVVDASSKVVLLVEKLGTERSRRVAVHEVLQEQSRQVRRLRDIVDRALGTVGPIAGFSRVDRFLGIDEAREADVIGDATVPAQSPPPVSGLRR